MDLKQRCLERYYYRWSNHVLFIAGLPKSGTNWLEQLLREIPGYMLRYLADPCGCLYNHDVCEACFESLPWDRYSIVRTHTRYTPDNLEAIRKFNLQTVVMYRDLRDQCISRYYHVLTETTHRHHDFYRSSGPEEGISHCIEITLEHYVPWVSDWLPFLANEPERFCEVRYEEMRSDPSAVLARVPRVLRREPFQRPSCHHG